MRLTLPQLEITREEGFTDKKDIFNRKQFGERLANLFENTQEDVVALDAQWGEGKSTFIKMWQGHVENHRDKKFKTIYFDAFENDYQKDPFLALTSEIYGLLNDEDESKKEEFKLKAGNALKSMARGALKIGIRSITGGILDGSIVDSAEKDISVLVADQIDNIIADRLKSSLEDKSALKHFRNYLQDIAALKGAGNPIIFIIDELDRCRPDFALELIEQIKHIFSVKGITFLLVLNRNQLEASVKARYGNDIDASRYLQKFINIWFTLPRSTETHDNHSKKYLLHSLNSMLEEEQFQNDYLKNILVDLTTFKKTSYREIERILSYVAIVHNMLKNANYNVPYQGAIAFICYLKASMPITFEKIASNSINFNDLLVETQLNVTNDALEEYFYLQNMITIIKFCLSDESIRSQMIRNREIDTPGFRISGNLLVNVAKILQTLEN